MKKRNIGVAGKGSAMHKSRTYPKDADTSTAVTA